ncbi:hypothetical protein [Kytococcus sedentarius]|uniref:hypothetical protein n=1 Tax=Kytococcus sedentarius TaxID=1276 RepID=UPI0035BBFA20
MNAPRPAVRVVQALVDSGLLPPESTADATRVVDETLQERGRGPAAPRPDAAGPDTPRSGARMAELAAYAVAALVVAAIGLLGAQFWGDLTAWQRAALLGTIGAVLLAGAAVAARVATGSWAGARDASLRTRLLVGTLVTAGTIAAAVSFALVVDELWAPEPYDPYNIATTAGAGLAIVLLAVAHLRSPSALLHVALGAAIVVLLAAVHLGEWPDSELRRALIVLAVGALWLLLLALRAWAEPAVGAGIGSLLLLVGAQLLLTLDTPAWAHAATLAVALLLFALYWALGHWPLLAVGVLAITVVVTEALMEWTDGSLGAGGAVLVAGLCLLAGSGAAVVLRRRREASYAG